MERKQVLEENNNTSVRLGNPLNLSISLSGGKETNRLFPQYWRMNRDELKNLIIINLLIRVVIWIWLVYNFIL